MFFGGNDASFETCAFYTNMISQEYYNKMGAKRGTFTVKTDVETTLL